MKLCSDPCCGKLLTQRKEEKIQAFEKRRYCNKSCAGQHQADRGKKRRGVANACLLGNDY